MTPTTTGSDNERYARRCQGATHPETGLPACLNVPRIEVSMVIRVNRIGQEVWMKACPYHAYRMVMHAIEHSESPGLTRVRKVLRTPDGRPIRRA